MVFEVLLHTPAKTQQIMGSFIAIHLEIFKQSVSRSFNFNWGGFFFCQLEKLMFNLLKEFELFSYRIVIHQTAASGNNRVILVLGVQQQV